MLAVTDVIGFVGFDGNGLDFREARTWTALFSRPGKEQDAADWLKRARLFAYWPCYVDQDRAAGQKRAAGIARRCRRFRALIPGYIFIADRASGQCDPFLIIHQTPGIVGFLRDATGHPARVTEADIGKIRRIEADANLPPDPKTAHRFRIGDKVRFRDEEGPVWPNGVVSALAEDGRIVVEVPLLGRVVPFRVYPHQIAPM